MVFVGGRREELDSGYIGQRSGVRWRPSGESLTTLLIVRDWAMRVMGQMGGLVIALACSVNATTFGKGAMTLMWHV